MKWHEATDMVIVIVGHFWHIFDFTLSFNSLPPVVVFSSQLIGADADEHLWLLPSHFLWEWTPTVSLHTKDKNDMLMSFSYSLTAVLEESA